MAQERPNRLAEWVVLIRTQAPVVRHHIAEWAHAIRANPGMLWQSLVLRYTVFSIVGLVFVLTLRSACIPPPEDASELARTADFHVICGNDACGYHFVINEKFGFDDFPVTCPVCGQESGYEARRCTSDYCKGKWILPYKDDEGVVRCSECGEPFP